MAELVRARINGFEKNVGRAYAETTDGVEVLDDEPTTNRDGSLRPTTRAGGRPVKPRTTVDDQATAKKKTAAGSAAADA